MGATPAVGVALAPSRGGEPPVGEELEVRLDCCAFSKRLKVGGLDDGDEVLLARERWPPGATFLFCGWSRDGIWTAEESPEF